MFDLNKAAEEIKDELIAVRTHIHEHPELSMQEYETCAYLEEYVKKNVAYDRLKRVGETGLWIEIKGTKPGKGGIVAFRGDIDALPIEEDASMCPRSQNPGVMHACGHDVHGTINVGAAKILSRMKDQFSGSVWFFLQPAEETLQGAKLFLEDPEIDFSKIDGVVAMHCFSDMETGTIGVRYGETLASSDEFHITVKGVGGHGAQCHTVKDPIVAASAVVMAMQTLVSRETNPANSVVVSICTFQAGNVHNIVPGEVKMKGTARTLNPQDQDRVEAGVTRIAKSISEAYGCTAEVNYMRGVPSLICDTEWAARAERVGKKLFGTENVVIVPNANMGGEDFAYMTKAAPGAFLRLGSMCPGGPVGSSHSSTFYADPNCIEIGVKTLVGIAADFFGVEI